jgi:hypothetical protein
MTSKIFIALCLVFTSLSISAQGGCGQAPDVGLVGPNMSRFEGRYNNPNYDFGVTIPSGLTGYSDPPPMPHHGFAIVLSWNPRSYIDVDGSYNSTYLPTTRAVLEQSIEFMRQNGAEIQSTKFSKIKLGLLSSIQVTIHYKCHNSPIDRVKHIAAILKNGIIYEIGLDTTEERYKADSKVFNALVASWHLKHHHTPLPKAQ